MEELSKIDFQKISDKIWSMMLEYGPKVILAIITLIIGLWIIKKLAKLAEKGMHLAVEDQTLSNFFRGFVEISLKILLFMSVASMIGIKTTSFLAIITLAALAVGFALKGTISNLAGGIILIIFKPYKLGDLIKVQGYFGKVETIELFNTIIFTNNRKTIIIPNGVMANSTIINYTTEGKLRIDLSVLISISYDLKKVKEILIGVLENDTKVLKDPAPFVGVSGLEEGSVNFAVRPWANSTDYWPVYFSINEKMKIALEESGIDIPELKWTDLRIN